MAFLYEYGLFLAKTITFVVAIAVVIGLIAGAALSRSKPKKGQLQFTDLSADYQDQTAELQQQLLEKKPFKQWLKAQKTKPQADKTRLFVLDFHGSMDARETDSLREEISAILSIAKADDEVLLRLESGGGVVHGYGLAASQLDRLNKRQINLTVAVDKVAASGGYMMACIGNKIIAAPFAIVGSIGVIAQLPNFNRLLKKHNVDFEQFTAGEFKRTVTLFGENTDKGRDKFQQELEQTHQLFKRFVTEHRPQLDIQQVATGEHWFGYQALELQLVDAIQTSDDYIMAALTERQVYQVKYQLRKGMAEKVGMGSANIVSQWWQKLFQLNWQR
ncbi:protease SohB [Rheinheimera sp.]|uniref:protease SohB n=1 Tax=Rheinheimera sp. TaxID=1869214 RepID=UPI0040479FED